ncbi:hypothetical protein KSP39_PZI022375 [Platanthera zijinensis]|uniref:Ultraviolet-B receptor UVR8 n=1 Tax=Platanthera zijinensis TaxID=2320716 RepID=A0AAP0FUK9_9ASPA
MDGQLGHNVEKSAAPTLIEEFKELGAPNALLREPNAIHETTTLKVSSIKAGGMMSLAIDNLGALWMWGYCPQPSSTEKEEEFSLVRSSSPLPVWDFHGHTVVKVACGNEHVVACVSPGENFHLGDLLCYSWGNNSHGQLGLGDRKPRARPQMISTFEEDSPWDIYEIACGAFHTAILTNKKSYGHAIESRCWTFGLGENGQLGHGTVTSVSRPEPVSGLPHETFLISLDCGLFHTSVVSAFGDVWSWGMEKGFGLFPGANDSGGDALTPKRLRCGETPDGLFPVPVQVACGAAHTVLVADDGRKLWAWGRGRSGVLGRGQIADSFVPAPLTWPQSEANSDKEVERRNFESKASLHPSGGMSVETAVDLSDRSRLPPEKLGRLMERYAAVLHFSVFRKPLDKRSLPQSLRDSEVFDVRQELENMMAAADGGELARLQVFYEGMLSAVKEKIMKRRIKEAVEEYILAHSPGRKP